MQPIITRLSLKGAIPPAMGQPLVPTIYLGMVPVEVGVNYGLASNSSTITSVNRGGFEVRTNQAGTKPALRLNGKQTTNKRKSTRPKNAKVRGRVRRLRTKTTSKGNKKTSGIRVLTRKDGRKVYMKNGKFIRKP